jgi:hypothetical protein
MAEKIMNKVLFEHDKIWLDTPAIGLPKRTTQTYLSFIVIDRLSRVAIGYNYPIVDADNYEGLYHFMENSPWTNVKFGVRRFGYGYGAGTQLARPPSSSCYCMPSLLDHGQYLE